MLDSLNEDQLERREALRRRTYVRDGPEARKNTIYGGSYALAGNITVIEVAAELAGVARDGGFQMLAASVSLPEEWR